MEVINLSDEWGSDGQVCCEAYCFLEHIHLCQIHFKNLSMVRPIMNRSWEEMW